MTKTSQIFRLNTNLSAPAGVLIFAICLLLTGFSSLAWSEEPDVSESLRQLSLEDLMNIEVTTVSRRAEKLSEAPAAVFVITQEDIRRSGANSIPEILRMAPGVQVCKITANKWAVSARGWTGRFANKLLVLIDGRSVYTPLFSGVYWEIEDVLLEDIERIEIIRGPGAALWGANAVNGVINIITKPAKETQGGLITAGAGSEERGFGGFRFGGRLSDNAWYRIYAKYFDRDSAEYSNGDTAHDDWRVGRAGFRIDWEPSRKDELTFTGEIYDGDMGQTLDEYQLTPPYISAFNEDLNASGGSLLGRWSREISEDSSYKLQTYYIHGNQEAKFSEETRDTFDIDFQHRFRLTPSQEIIWGLGYRLTMDEFKSTPAYAIIPDDRQDHLFSAFVQDDILLIEDKLHLILGAKFEHNDYTGFEFQPNARLLWTPHENHTFWASVARAVRTPNRSESDGRFQAGVLEPGELYPGSPPVLIEGRGNEDLESEELTAYEVGYRTSLSETLTLDLSLFYNQYDDLVSSLILSPEPVMTPVPHLVLPVTGENGEEGETYGGELVVNWQARKWWKLIGAYSYIHWQIPEDELIWDTPSNQFTLRSLMDLSSEVELDTMFRYVDNFPRFGVPAYYALNVRLGWNPSENLEFSLVGEHLLNDTHREHGRELFTSSFRTEVEHSVYGKVTWRF